MRAEIVQVVKHSPGRFTSVMRFLERVHIDALVATEPFLIASRLAAAIDVERHGRAADRDDHARSATTWSRSSPTRRRKEGREDKEGKEAKEPRGELTRAQVQAIVDPDKLVDAAVPYLELERDDLTALLIETDTMKRLERIIPSLERQATVLRLKADIGAELEGESSRNHRERVLRDRMRQIQEELGEQDDNAEIDELRKKIEDSKMSDEVRAVAKKQLSRMSQMASSSPEYNIARTYVENLLEIPWNVFTDDRLDVSAARAILEAEHSGLEKVKRRILEFLAVRKLAPNKHGPILLLVGPPGVGKTSLGKLDRELARPQVRADLARRRARRGRGPRSPPHVHRRPPRPHRRGPQEGRLDEPGVRARRDRQARRRHAGRPGRGHARGPRSRAEQGLRRSLRRGPGRPVEGDVHLHREPARHDQPAAARPHGDGRALRLHHASRSSRSPRTTWCPSSSASTASARSSSISTTRRSAEIIHSYTREAGVRNLEREIAAVCRGAAVKVAEGATDRCT